MPAKPLFRLALEAGIAHSKWIDDYGDIPYHMVKPMLAKVDVPQQLAEIERNSPQMRGADADLWQAFIKRDIRNWQNRQLEPQNPLNWSKLYKKLRKEDDDLIKEAQEKLKADMDSRNAEKQNNQMGFVDRVINPVRKGVPKPRFTTDRSGYMSSLHFGSGSRTSAATGRSTLNKVKRETREASVFGARKTALSTPTHLLNQNVSHGRIVGPRTSGGVYQPQVQAPLPPAPLPPVTRQPAVTSMGTSASVRPPARPQTPQSQPHTPSRPSPQKRAGASVFLPQKRRKL